VRVWFTREEFNMHLVAAVSIIVMLFAAGCGGGGSGGGEGASRKEGERFTIERPVSSGSTYNTSGYSVALSGDTFLWPAGANCRPTRPQPIDVFWRNSANGTNGSSKSYAGCLCDPFGCVPNVGWRISYGVVPLEIGNNTITVTGSAPGESQSASLTVTREEGAASINFYNEPDNLTIGSEYRIAVTVRDGANAPLPDQVVDWRSLDESLATVESSNLPTNQQGMSSADILALGAGTVAITATISGTDSRSTISLDILEPLPPPFDADPPGEDLPSKPELLMPVTNAVISQERPEECGVNPEHNYGHKLYFDWTDVSFPQGMGGYYLVVRHSGSQTSGREEYVIASEFTDVSCGSYIIDSNLTVWEWWVQAEDMQGNRGPSSERGLFQFAPCRRDDGSPCQAWIPP
jgi:hypothetical protein